MGWAEEEADSTTRRGSNPDQERGTIHTGLEWELKRRSFP